FLQTLPLASNALAIRIIFPSVRAIRASFNPTGLPASLGKQKRSALRSLGIKRAYCVLKRCQYFS
ncbi:hypothetical protein D8T43_22630, partial [Vibrio vulnificus]